jgi:hypothetical protein
VHLADFMLSLLVIFFMVVYFMILFRVIIDVFRNRDMSGGMKAVWLIALLIFPLITLLIYVIMHGSGMTQRDVADMEAARKAQESYIRDVAAAPTSPTDEIARGQELLKSGAITQAEFDQLKAHALGKPNPSISVQG